MGRAWKENTDCPQIEDVRLSLGILAQYTGEQAGALLLIVQALTRNNLISVEESEGLVSLLLPEQTSEPQNSVTAAVIAPDKRRQSRAAPQTD